MINPDDLGGSEELDDKKAGVSKELIKKVKDKLLGGNKGDDDGEEDIGD